MHRVVIAFKRIVIFGLIWLALTKGDPAGFAVGFAAAIASGWLSLRLLPPGGPHGPFVSLLALARMLPFFLWRSVLGGIDVASRALHPRMPLKAGWVIVPTGLPRGGARAALGGEFSLLPGTLVAGSVGDDLLVHCLDTDQAVAGDIETEENKIAEAVGLRRIDRARASEPDA